MWSKLWKRIWPDPVKQTHKHVYKTVAKVRFTLRESGILDADEKDETFIAEWRFDAPQYENWASWPDAYWFKEACFCYDDYETGNRIHLPVANFRKIEILSVTQTYEKEALSC